MVRCYERKNALVMARDGEFPNGKDEDASNTCVQLAIVLSRAMTLFLDFSWKHCNANTY